MNIPCFLVFSGLHRGFMGIPASRILEKPLKTPGIQEVSRRFPGGSLRFLGISLARSRCSVDSRESTGNSIFSWILENPRGSGRILISLNGPKDMGYPGPATPGSILSLNI